MMKDVRPCIKGFHPSLDQRFGQRVHAGVASSMMKISGSCQHGPRQADELFLPNREQVAAFTHVLIITFLEGQ